MTATDIAKLSIEERLALIGTLCDSLIAENVVLTPAQEAELARRIATIDHQPYALSPEEEAVLESSLKAANCDDFATDEEIRAIWAKFGR